MKITEAQRVFCSYAFTGEDEVTVQDRMKKVVETFAVAGISAYCNLDDPYISDFKSAKQFIDHGLRVLKTKDVLFVLMASERRSEGMLIEVGAAYAVGKPIVLARHNSANGKTYLDTLATYTFDWATEEELLTGIKTLI